MGTACDPAPAKLFLAIMASTPAQSDQALTAFCERWGMTDLHFGPIPFNFTDYYTKEMGPTLQKVFYAFTQPIKRDSLSAIKCVTNDIEEGFRTTDGARTVNLDPGYLTNEKLVLASTKDFYHRIYLGAGIYAEVTLHYRQGKWRHFSWTYPDYKTEGVQRFLEKARAKLVGELRLRNKD
ncbi:MAG: DUF4416 family protein [Chitinivibrionales bacterium]|nr:DUF4416 family protein [Chitinivibrionales bacterium]MBD3356375.1 DUF4416 family protein [Chitinivibrionales bacterium]